MSQPRLNNQIRFSVYDDANLIHQTEWLPERTPQDAVVALGNVRQQLGGNYAYTIERTGDSKIPNPVKLTRYTIKDGEAMLYSKLLTESEKDAALAEIRAMYPKGQISEVTI